MDGCQTDIAGAVSVRQTKLTAEGAAIGVDKAFVIRGPTFSIRGTRCAHRTTRRVYGIGLTHGVDASETIWTPLSGAVSRWRVVIAVSRIQRADPLAVVRVDRRDSTVVGRKHCSATVL